MLIFLLAVIAAVLLFGRDTTIALLLWGTFLSVAGLGLIILYGVFL